MNDEFKKQIDRLLQASGRTFKGIHLRCDNCGEEAFAATPQAAEMFGWSQVTQLKGANYGGFCIDCKDSSPNQKGESHVKEWIDVGSAPTDEECAQVGSVAYHPRARRECQAYVRQLRRIFGSEPDGARLAIHSNPHDFGTYLSVVCHYDPAKQASIDYAFRCENQSPEHWDDEALRELAQREGGAP